jgi:hypothetical protein
MAAHGEFAKIEMRFDSDQLVMKRYLETDKEHNLSYWAD